MRPRGPGNEDGPDQGLSSFSYPEPFLRAVRRGALAKSKTGNHKNMVKDIYVIRTITFVVANQMPSSFPGPLGRTRPP